MESGTQIALSCALTFGVPLVLAVRELVLLRRAAARDSGSGRRGAAPLPPAPTGTAGPLPDCLVPKARARALEEA